MRPGGAGGAWLVAGSGRTPRGGGLGAALRTGGSTRHRACHPAPVVSFNPLAGWVMLSHSPDEKTQRHALSCSRSHSSSPALPPSPRVLSPGSQDHKFTKNVDVPKPGCVWRGSWSHGVRGYTQGYWGEQAWGSRQTPPQRGESRAEV